MGGQTVLDWLARAADAIHERRDELTALDAAIGDADHGINLDRGFAAVVEELSSWQRLDTGAILSGVARILISRVGGASGALYGTAFLRAGTALAGKADLTGTDLLVALEAAAGGIAARGRATLGEKTMLDAFLPAVNALREALAAGQSLPEAVRLAAAAAEDGMLATIPMTATKGRAANLGPRSSGHQDPGATSTALLFDALAQALSGAPE